MTISHHAVDRFVTRIRPDLTFADAERLLWARMQQAKRLRERTPKGDQRWLLTDPPCVVVLRPTRTRGESGLVAITVLGPDEDEAAKGSP